LNSGNLSRSTGKFLSYYPLKQGLKRGGAGSVFSLYLIFILLSIKTRIETEIANIARDAISKFLSYYPLKQGLKQVAYPGGNCIKGIFILLSIKTRIETPSSRLKAKSNSAFLSYYPLKQGLKQNMRYGEEYNE